MNTVLHSSFLYFKDKIRYFLSYKEKVIQIISVRIWISCTVAPCCDKADLSATGGHWNNRSPETVVALLLLRSQEVLYPRWWSLCSTPRRFRAFQLLSFNFVKVALRNAKTNPRVKQASILPLDLGFVVLDLGFWRVNRNYYNRTILKTIVLLVIYSHFKQLSFFQCNKRKLKASWTN